MGISCDDHVQKAVIVSVKENGARIHFARVG